MYQNKRDCLPFQPFYTLFHVFLLLFSPSCESHQKDAFTIIFPVWISLLLIEALSRKHFNYFLLCYHTCHINKVKYFYNWIRHSDDRFPIYILKMCSILRFILDMSEYNIFSLLQQHYQIEIYGTPFPWEIAFS